MKKDRFEQLEQSAQIARLDDEFVILNDEQADDMFGGKLICFVIGSNNGNC